VSVRIVRFGALLGNQTYIHELLGLPSLPPNQFSVTLPIPISYATFTGIIFQAIGSFAQPTIYFDDLLLVSHHFLLLPTLHTKIQSLKNLR
jgi:hypothetical protein